MAAGAANVAIALFGDAASENLVVLPAEVNIHGLLDQGVGANGAGNPLEGLAGLLVVRDDPTMHQDEFRLMSRPAGRDVTDLYAVA